MRERNDLQGPSRYAVKVIRSLLSRPKTIEAIVEDTGLQERTVKAQIDALRKSDAVRRKTLIPSHHRQGGPIAIYETIVMEVR